MGDVDLLPIAGPNDVRRTPSYRGNRRRRGGAAASSSLSSLQPEQTQAGHQRMPSDNEGGVPLPRNPALSSYLQGPSRTQSVDQQAQTDGNRNDARPRGNRRNRRGGPRADGGDAPSSAPQQIGVERERSGRGRGSRGRGGTVIAPPRSFGGHLTTEDDNTTEVGQLVQSTTSDQNANLRAEANNFEPGKPHVVAGPSNQVITVQSGVGAKMEQDKKARNKEPKKPKTVKEAEDLMTRIHDEISSGSYECMICYGGVTRRGKVWDCRRCYAVFHLNCIQKWAKQALDQPAPQNEEIAQQRTWRCPGCQNASANAPKKYTCWCTKTDNPEQARYIAPHSCGQTCGKERETPKSCPHACDLQCHAGPCPPCTAMGPSLPCFCGKEVSQKRCLDTDYEGGWTCGQVCGDIMPCGEHTCERPCHTGLCGACEVVEELQCYCGAVSKDIKCFEKLEPQISEKEADGGIERWEGHFECETACNRSFDCGKHECTKGCHPQEAELSHCPYSPDVVDHCPCGKTKLDPSQPRQSCQDPIPHCDKTCEKILKCGHQCEQTCHTGDCGICLKNIPVSCRCGRTHTLSLCHQGEPGDPPQCPRVCHANLNCNRHECGEKCCSGEQLARERTSKKKASRVATEDIEPEHVCTRLCGKLLKCGTHYCNALCHRGPCGSCLEASFDELTCQCGRTRLMPPIPCGTLAPKCNYPCTRPKACGHPATNHLCHGDDEECPKCPWLVDKTCLCGRRSVKNQPCYRDVVSCGQPCGQKLSCGSHLCQSICHAPGACDEPCRQICAKSKSICGHPCQDLCHAPFVCSETKPCETKMQVTCACGHLKQEVKCNASKSNPSPKRTELKCVDACRMRRLAQALNIDTKAREERELSPYSDDVMGYYVDHKSWCATVEKNIRDFCSHDSKKRLAFSPMKSRLRQFVHALVEDYGLDSESEDPEPYRSVVVTKNSTYVVPKKTLAEAYRMPIKSDAAVVEKAGSGIQQLKKAAKQAVNALVLTGLRVGLLNSELEKELDVILRGSTLRFSTKWTGNEEVVLEPIQSSLSPDELELELMNVKPIIKQHCIVRKLATSVELCWMSRDGHLTSRESKQWNVVSGAKAGSGGTYSKPQPQTYSNAFNVLSGANPSSFASVTGSAGRPGQMFGLKLSRPGTPKVEKKKEKEKKVEVVDDWEAEAEKEEMVDKLASGDEKEGVKGKARAKDGESVVGLFEKLSTDDTDTDTDQKETIVVPASELEQEQELDTDVEETFADAVDTQDASVEVEASTSHIIHSDLIEPSNRLPEATVDVSEEERLEHPIVHDVSVVDEQHAT